MERLLAGAEKLGLHLTLQQLEQFEVYYRELIDWNKRINLTAITDYEEVQVKHFLDSLTVILGIKPDSTVKNLNVVDVGTGAGLPGIPLKIAFPDVRLTLLEATAKKAKFLEHLVQKLRLKDVAIVAKRSEEIAHESGYREQYDIALSRAVASLPALVELTLPFCAPGGYFIAQKKGDITSEVEQSRKAIEIMGGRLREIKSIGLSEFNDSRCLVIIEKVKSTPPEYPRRPGLPEKRPLIIF